MIVNKDKIRFGITDILTVAVSLLYLLGIRLWFPVCEPMESGFMSCHWAGEALKAVSVVLLTLSVAHAAIADEKIKIGMDISLCGVYAFAFCIPGRIISLCKMAEMSCRSHSQFWTIIFMIALMVIVIADIVLYMTSSSNEKHSRVPADKGEKR